jgi:hypothetical protein
MGNNLTMTWVASLHHATNLQPELCHRQPLPTLNAIARSGEKEL